MDMVRRDLPTEWIVDKGLPTYEIDRIYDICHLVRR